MNATASEWEVAWEEYTEALARFDETFPTRHKPRHVREHNRSKTRLGNARKSLRALDREFCERLGI